MKTKVREEQILSDQEQLRRALSSALQSQGLELCIKNQASNTALDGIMLADLESKVTNANSSFLSPWGFDSAKEVMGGHIGDFWLGEKVQRILETLTRTGGMEGGTGRAAQGPPQSQRGRTERQGETPAEKAPAPNLARRQGTILVVDDEPQVREVISRVLARRGYTVITVQDGRDALVRFGDGSEIDLVVLDMVMPGMGGRECLARLCKANPAVRVVIVTGYTTDGSPQELLGAGAMAIMEKPFNLAAFAGIIQIILQT